MTISTTEPALSPAPERRLLRLPEVRQKVGLSRSAIYKLISEGQFPRQISIGPRSVAWCQQDLERWIEERLNPPDPANPPSAASSPPAGANTRRGCRQP
jgi:prophage regulatory protein